MSEEQKGSQELMAAELQAQTNIYGHRARKYWEKYRPREYASLANPAKFFLDLGLEMEGEIEDLERKIAGPDPQTQEPYLTKVGRLREARLSAESEVWASKIPQPEGEEENPAS